jgi:hypothetical protein
MATYDKYIKEGIFDSVSQEEELTADDLVSDTLSTEDIYKIKIMSVRAGVPFNLVRKVVSKVYKGMSISDPKEKVILMDVLRFFLSPEKAMFRTILSKI